MGLFVLSETSAGYGLFKATDKKLLEAENLGDRLKNAGSIQQELKFKSFERFGSAAAALEEISTIIEGKVPDGLANLLDTLKNEKKVTLAVAETKLGNAITKLPGLNIKPVNDSATTDLFRAVRQHITELIPGLQPENFKETTLGLAHSLSRHKVKFSPDKVDVMIIHAVSLLDDLDKELNTYAMRVKEWYGWHFPELAKILPDNLSYARVILALGMRSNAKDADLSEILPHEIEAAVKAAADISMGTEISGEDLENIKLLAEQVVAHSEYRLELSQYLENRMRAIAPNVTELVGPLVGARLIAHCKSLVNLAKQPGSTIQILGAEKALFRALKTKHNTPKYGLIYHASLVGQASGPNKGKIARQLAAKLALGVRTDALEEWDDDIDEDEKAKLGVLSRAKLENNLRRLEGKPLSKGISSGANGVALPSAKWDVKEARKYNIDADGLVGDEPATVAKKPLIQEVEDQDAGNDEDMEDAPTTKNGITEAPRSPTLASISDDTEDEPEESENWQSEIQGATREAKKARKKERHERAAEQAPDKAAKRAARKDQEKRRIEREERRVAKREQESRREAPQTSSTPNGKVSATPKKVTEADYERLAKLAGLSVKKFAKKFEKGQIKVKEDGTLEVAGKKEAKESDEETPIRPKSSKRKHAAEDEEEEAPVKEEKPKKKKKKHHKEAEE